MGLGEKLDEGGGHQVSRMTHSHILTCVTESTVVPSMETQAILEEAWAFFLLETNSSV